MTLRSNTNKKQQHKKPQDFLVATETETSGEEPQLTEGSKGKTRMRTKNTT